jgi:hypothetical protein
MSERYRRVARRLLRDLGAAAAVAVWASASADAPAADPRSLMAQVYQQDRSHAVSIRARFDVYDASGQIATKKFTYRRTGSASNSKALVVFSEPQDIRGVTLLSLAQPGEPARQYIYIPATRRVRSVVAQQRSASFAGTDFTFEDIEEKNVDDFSYRLLGDREIVDGHRTYHVEATPVSATASQYKAVHYWLAQDVPVILQAELYDPQGVLVRVMHASVLRQISGIWGARRSEMRTVHTGTRTVLTVEDARFDTRLDDRLFTPAALETTSDSGTRP